MNSNDIDLSKILKDIYNSKLKIGLITSLFFIASIIYSLSITNYYVSISTAINQKDDMQGSQFSSSGLTSLLGLNLGGQDKDLIRYSLELKSMDFFKMLYQKDDFLINLMAVNGYDQAEKKSLFNSKIYDVKLNKWKKTKNSSLKPDLQIAHKIFKNKFYIEYLPDKGVLLLSFEHYSPNVSFYILKTTLEEFNKYKKDKNKMKSRETIIYLQDLQAQATNQVTRGLASSVIERELSKTAYMNIPSYEYLEIIESPIEPKFKAGPRRTLIVLLMTFLGFLLSIIYVAVKIFFRK